MNPDTDATNIDPGIYNPDYLERLFNEMQGTYEIVSTLSSFGFNRRWRQQLIALIDLQPGMQICDLMTGTGEAWKYLLPRIGAQGKLVAVDFSDAMIQGAEIRKARIGANSITIIRADVLESSLPPESMDVIVCIYGVKTLGTQHETSFVEVIQRLLKPGGAFGIVEVSVPGWLFLRALYLFYLGYIVPIIGKLLLGNPENYRMLSRYMTRFQNCSRLAEQFSQKGFAVHSHSFFYGCATALTGTKPE